MPREAHLTEASQRSWCLIQALHDEGCPVGIGSKSRARFLERLRVWQHQGACGYWLVIQPRATQHRIRDQQHGILGNLLEKAEFQASRPDLTCISTSSLGDSPAPWSLRKHCCRERVGFQPWVHAGSGTCGWGWGAQKGQTDVSHVSGWRMCPKVNDDLSQNLSAV